MKPRNQHQTTYTDSDVSQFHWTNGLPPTPEESPEFNAAREDGWKSWTLTLKDEVNGTEKVLTLDDLKALPQVSYVATHTCMQGWSATSRWTGVRIQDVIGQLGPKPDGANYVMIESYGLAQKMYDNRPREPFYACIDLGMLAEEDTILAYERNGHPIEEYLGGPARARIESGTATRWSSGSGPCTGSRTTRSSATVRAAPARTPRCRPSTEGSRWTRSESPRRRCRWPACAPTTT